jgi:FkbM family methyltransferase
MSRARAALGVARSLGIYYLGRERRRAMDRLYGGFLGAGDLAFDIGSHVGDRIASFRRLGARVVAVEPQAALARTLRLLYGRDPAVTLVTAAVGGTAGDVDLFVNRANPTVSTVSAAFVAAARGAPGWEGQVWDGRVRVPQVTLDDLVAAHGEPAFVKLDIEGSEAEALAGLSHPVGALSFECTTIQRDQALACLDHCRRLGDYRFNAALGETQRLVHRRWLRAAEMGEWVAGLPHDANSGDIYARLVGTRGRSVMMGSAIGEPGRCR